MHDRLTNCHEYEYLNHLSHLCNDTSSTPLKAFVVESSLLEKLSDRIPNQLHRYDVPQGNGLLAHQLGAVCWRRTFPSRVRPGVQLTLSMSRRVWVRARQCLSSEPEMLLWSLLHQFMMARENLLICFAVFWANRCTSVNFRRIWVVRQEGGRSGGENGGMEVVIE
jgi:hypothetical protein